ncbi:hypothetical protein BDV96DRAFT_280835 [Lophiotrema nucula]|uniref:MARVEL domain-containing protein n=1 Tax=Lophiotrema nucula TaxID=690887 RepID=A0A6A5ZMS1_9PLEO|nr:hypothetical protein BDV96DRAFT_280835 [Lophiotrema nucula]
MPSKLRARPTQKPSLVAQIASGLSFIAALIVSGILSFFIDALRRGYRSVPWPIVIVMAASFLNIVSVFFTAILRCLAPGLSLLLFFIHVPVGLLWLISTALLGRELDDHLRSKCPTSSEMGHDISLVCHLFKALFAFSVTATFFSLLVAFFDIKVWRQSKTAKYTAVETNAGGTAQSIKEKRRGKIEILAGIFKQNKSTQEDERGIMLESMRSEDNKRKDYMLFQDVGEGQERLRTAMPSPDMGPRQRVQVGGYRSQIDGQETRYVPGTF